MELDLKLQDMTWFEETNSISATQEESLETAIPEYCPDIARIVDTVGQICLQEKQQTSTGWAISGAVRVRVLYTSEESAGLRVLSVAVPFRCTAEDSRLALCRTVDVSSRLLLCEAKAVTSRKVYVRVMPEISVLGYGQQKCRICTRTEDSLQQRWAEWEAELLCDVGERELSYTQEMLLESTAPIPEEVLTDHIWLRTVECRHIGSKLVVKGEASLSVLYRAEGQKLCTYDTVVPFSKIIDGMDQPEAVSFDVWPRCSESELRVIRTEGSCGFGLTARIVLLIFAKEKKTLRYLSDLYSTRCPTQVEYTAVRPAVNYCRSRTEKELVQKIEGGTPFFYLTQAECGQVTSGADGEQTALRTTVRMKILYLDESGAPMSAERSAEVAASVQSPPVYCRSDCGVWRGSSGEVRIPVAFQLCTAQQQELQMVSEAKLLEEQEAEPMPSLVLRRREAGESLWDIAKQYRSEEKLIESVNESTEGMLLIPRA